MKYKKISILLGVFSFFSFLYGSSGIDQKIKIAFVINELSFRGVEVSTFDYAHFNEVLLGNESIIINFDVKTDNEVRKKFVTRFPDRFFDCMTYEELDYILDQENVDILYYQKPGHNDGVVSKVCKNAVHAVFPGIIQPHGDVYAFISEWFLLQFPDLNLPFVPYLVRVEDTPENLRKELNIPEDAIVFGRHGGFGSFNVPCAQDAVKEVAQAHPDLYFVFLNTQEFCHLPNVIFLPKTTDMLYKAKFINTCDAMVHARWRGETFGLACAEFSIKNKPVITWTDPRERAHIDLLGNKAFYFHTKEDLVHILTSFKKEPEKNWDAYSAKFSPEVVMKKFDEVFIQPLITKNKSLATKKKLLFKATRTSYGLDEKFMQHMQELFDVAILIKEGAAEWCTVDHMQPFFEQIHMLERDTPVYERTVERFKGNDRIYVHHQDFSIDLSEQKKILMFFDCYWRAQMEQKNHYVAPLSEQLLFLDDLSKGQAVIVIDGIHLLDHKVFEQLYKALTSRAYQFFIMKDTIIAFQDSDVFVAPIIRAMTMSWLCEINSFAKNKTISDLLSAERVIARILASDGQEKREFECYAPTSSFASRYYQLWQGLSLFYQGKYHDAAVLFQNVISQGYTHWRIYWYLGLSFYKLGDIKAEAPIIQALREFPQFQDALDFKQLISA